EARQKMTDERVGRAVELGYRNNVRAAPCEIEERVVQGGLTRGDAKGRLSTLQRGDPALEYLGRRVADACVAVTLGLEVEQRGAMLCAVELVGHGLVNRHRGRPRGGIAMIAAVDGDGFVAHRPHPLSSKPPCRRNLLGLPATAGEGQAPR